MMRESESRKTSIGRSRMHMRNASEGVGAAKTCFPMLRRMRNRMEERRVIIADCVARKPVSRVAMGGKGVAEEKMA